VQKLIEEDRHVTYREIQTSLGIGMSQIQKILHDELWVRKLISRWVPHNLSEEQKVARVTWCRTTLERFNGGTSNLVYNIVSGDESWIYAYEPESKTQSTVWSFVNELKPTKVTRSRSVSKKMVASFVAKSGHVATICLEDRKTVTAEWYTTICLPEVIAELRKTDPKRRIILHHDNASSHTARRTIEFLAENKIDLMDHPPYSPDLSPNDYFTFPRIKEKLRGQRFQSPEEAVEAYKMAILTTPTSEWNECFNNWFERMEKCIKFDGIYFEKQ
jgi:[histone H3]-lysine36 N-dimethyltransferase SETMAR